MLRSFFDVPGSVAEPLIVDVLRTPANGVCDAVNVSVPVRLYGLPELGKTAPELLRVGDQNLLGKLLIAEIVHHSLKIKWDGSVGPEPSFSACCHRKISIVSSCSAARFFSNLDRFSGRGVRSVYPRS